MAKAEFVAITETVLDRARSDPAYRQQVIAQNLDFLLATLNKLRKANASATGDSAKQIREGVELAVKLAELLHKLGQATGNSRAA